VAACCPLAPYRAKIAPRTLGGVPLPVLRPCSAPPQSLAVGTSPAPNLISDHFDTVVALRTVCRNHVAGILYYIYYSQSCNVV
jgi:hypothetical protein